MKACLVIVFTLSLFISFSCAKKQVREEPIPRAEPTTTIPEEPAVIEEGKLEESELDSTTFREISEDQQELKAIFKDIYFDYDDFSLRFDARDTLNNIAEWLLKNPSRQILIEGHCDERGTNEYNLALGERRANSAKKYLGQLGVDPQTISTISYGEEKPVELGHNEAAWSKNRRDHFLIR